MPRIAKREVDDFAPVERIYTDTEIRDFHQKIQKFWCEPREVTLDKGRSGTAQKFDHEALHVAYGAARKVDSGGGRFHYLYNQERNRQLNVLWNQYESWRKKQDWIENKNTEAMSEIAEQVPF